MLQQKEAACSDLEAQLEASKEATLRQAEAHAMQMSQAASRNLASTTKLELEVKHTGRTTCAVYVVMPFMVGKSGERRKCLVTEAVRRHG